MAQFDIKTLFEKNIFYSLDGCWYWIGAPFCKGYGQFKNKLAHRVSYEIFNKVLTPSHIYHSCANKLCVNPDHLTTTVPSSFHELGRTRKKTGSPIKPRNKECLKTRFEKYIMPEPNSGCWFWLARINPAGYGVFGVGKKRYKAHRYSYELYKNTITDNKLVCHTCDTPSCINPDHLFLGTHKDNVQDMIKKGRASWQQDKTRSLN